MTYRAAITGWGDGLPRTAVSNLDLIASFNLETSNEWIVQRTGIESRYIADEDETVLSLGIQASQKALERARVSPEEVDLVIVTTVTAERAFPSTAIEIQERLGMKNAIGFDLQAACSGFVFGLEVADLYVRSDQARTVLLVGADIMSRLLDWRDRNTCILFGDGAGAALIQRLPSNGQGRGILSTHLNSQGKYADLLYTHGKTGPLRMSGREVFRHAIVNLTSISQQALQRHQLKPEHIDWFIPHQANLRIIQSVAADLNIPMDRSIVTIKEHGNTSSASIPLALARGIEDGWIKPGNLLLLAALGGGFCWGASVLRW